jgi:hypothetical protein
VSLNKPDRKTVAEALVGHGRQTPIIIFIAIAGAIIH